MDEQFVNAILEGFKELDDSATMLFIASPSSWVHNLFVDIKFNRRLCASVRLCYPFDVILWQPHGISIKGPSIDDPDFFEKAMALLNSEIFFHNGDH